MNKKYQVLRCGRLYDGVTQEWKSSQSILVEDHLQDGAWPASCHGVGGWYFKRNQHGISAYRRYHGRMCGTPHSFHPRAFLLYPDVLNPGGTAAVPLYEWRRGSGPFWSSDHETPYESLPDEPNLAC